MILAAVAAGGVTMATEIVLRVELTVGPWEPDGADTRRLWSGPPRDNGNTAARVERTAWCWPFAKYEWAVWSPFDDNAAVSGEAKTAAEGMRLADEALAELVQAAMTPDAGMHGSAYRTAASSGG